MKFLAPIYLVLAFAAIEVASFGFDGVLKHLGGGEALRKVAVKKTDHYYRKHTTDGKACHEKGWCAEQCCFAFNDQWNCPFTGKGNCDNAYCEKASSGYNCVCKCKNTVFLVPGTPGTPDTYTLRDDGKYYREHVDPKRFPSNPYTHNPYH